LLIDSSLATYSAARRQIQQEETPSAEVLPKSRSVALVKDLPPAQIQPLASSVQAPFAFVLDGLVNLCGITDPACELDCRRLGAQARASRNAGFDFAFPMSDIFSVKELCTKWGIHATPIVTGAVQHGDPRGAHKEGMQPVVCRHCDFRQPLAVTRKRFTCWRCGKTQMRAEMTSP
jgi:hypothetical protein